MAHSSVPFLSAAPARGGSSVVRLSRRNQAPRAITARRSAQVTRCMASFQSIEVSSVNSMVDQGFIFVDIRADWEAEKYGKMDSWVNVPLAFLTDNGPLKNPDFTRMMQEKFPDRNTPLLIACDDGEIRSEIAAKDLQNMGYTQVYIVRGGTDDYLEQLSNGGQSQYQEPAQAPSNLIAISYRTGWTDCFVHFNVDDKGWTESPGWKMEQQGDVKVLVVEGSRMEFCLNNGGDQWDAPPGNYNIFESGSYFVADGAAHKQ